MLKLFIIFENKQIRTNAKIIIHNKLYDFFSFVTMLVILLLHSNLCKFFCVSEKKETSIIAINYGVSVFNVSYLQFINIF